MKNTHIKNLLAPVPIGLRLELYRGLLKRIEESPRFSQKHFSLCLELPIELWGLESYLSNGPDGEDWNHKDTLIAFPELLPEHIEDIQSRDPENYRGANDWRCNYLARYINQIENTL